MRQFSICYSIFTVAWIVTILIHHFIYPSATAFSANDWSGWGTWVGAAGTFAAFIGTIRLAQTETRRRENQEVARARLVAARIAPELQLVFDDFSTLYRTFEEFQPTPGVVGNREELIPERLWNSLDDDLLEYDTLAQLVPLERDIALNISTSLGLLRHELHEISRMLQVENWAEAGLDGRKAFVQKRLKNFRSPYALMRRAVLDIREVTKANPKTSRPDDVFSPSDESFYDSDPNAPLYDPDSRPFRRRI